jgi:hypothetical protein
MKLLITFALLLANTTAVQAQIKAPVLKNRVEIIKERDRAAQRLVGRGDTTIVWVFVDVDLKGVPTRVEAPQNDIKPAIKQAAIELVWKMRFIPALDHGKPRKSITKVPVRFARPA